ncbi:MAG TPA: hypothetical protein VN902_03065 [Candidatus Acidoferrales bacterium]|nr:hypothetical protein [Candidatus Acidoferrales bacterium]
MPLILLNRISACAPCYALPMCKVCKSPPETLGSINKMLKDRVTLSKIAEFSGIHRSIIGRHSLNCVPKQVLKTHRQNFYHGERILIQYVDTNNWPYDDTPFIFQSSQPAEISPDDTVICVRYDNFDATKAYNEKLQAFLHRKPAIAEARTTAEGKRAALQKQIIEDYEAQKTAPASEPPAEETKDLQRTCDSSAPEILAVGDQVTDS